MVYSVSNGIVETLEAVLGESFGSRWGQKGKGSEAVGRKVM